MTIVFRGDVYSHIECNVCGTPAPSRQEMTEKNAHGITGLGWIVPKGQGGVHLCPEHAGANVSPAPPRRELVE